jgi:RNA polymerase sigma-70 factor (ECF subfamily)
MRLSGVKPTAELVESCWPEAYRIAFSILRNHADAEDAAQEACVQLHLTLPDLRAERAFKCWFYRIAVRKAYDISRRARRHSDSEPLKAAESEIHVDQSLDLARALDGLSRNQRITVILKYYYGFSDAETAQILRTSHAAIRVRLFAARRSLRRLLESDSITEGSVCHDQQ